MARDRETWVWVARVRLEGKGKGGRRRRTIASLGGPFYWLYEEFRIRAGSRGRRTPRSRVRHGSQKVHTSSYSIISQGPLELPRSDLRFLVDKSTALPLLFPHPLSANGLRQERRPPPLDIPPDTGRCLVQAKRGEHLLRCRSPRQRRCVIFLCLFTTACSQHTVPEFRIFPYETPSLEPFETAVAALNPLVAVKVRSAAVHAALAEV